MLVSASALTAILTVVQLAKQSVSLFKMLASSGKSPEEEKLEKVDEIVEVLVRLKDSGFMPEEIDKELTKILELRRTMALSEDSRTLDATLVNISDLIVKVIDGLSPAYRGEEYKTASSAVDKLVYKIESGESKPLWSKE